MVVQDDETKHLFYDFVRLGWDLTDELPAAQNGTPQYQWSKAPVRGHGAGYNWEETMFWIGLRIQHSALCEELWTNYLDLQWKTENLLNV